MFSKVPCEKLKKYVNIVQNLDRERENEDILTAVVNVTTEYKIDNSRLKKFQGENMSMRQMNESKMEAQCKSITSLGKATPNTRISIIF